MQRLEGCGVIGVTDSMSLLGGNFKAIAGLSGKTKALGEVTKAVFSVPKMTGAHRAAADVEGLVWIVFASKSMKSCLLEKSVGIVLSEWWGRQEKLPKRAQWERDRDARAVQGGR